MISLLPRYWVVFWRVHEAKKWSSLDRSTSHQEQEALSKDKGPDGRLEKPCWQRNKHLRFPKFVISFRKSWLHVAFLGKRNPPFEIWDTASANSCLCIFLWGFTDFYGNMGLLWSHSTHRRDHGKQQKTYNLMSWCFPCLPGRGEDDSRRWSSPILDVGRCIFTLSSSVLCWESKNDNPNMANVNCTPVTSVLHSQQEGDCAHAQNWNQNYNLWWQKYLLS